MNIEPDHPYYIDHDDSGDGRYDDSNAAEHGLTELWASCKHEWRDLRTDTDPYRLDECAWCHAVRGEESEWLADPKAQQEYQDWLDSLPHF